MSEELSVFDAIYNCRAMRRLDSREVPEEMLIKLVDAANQAPSGSNMQAGRWLIVRDSARIEDMTFDAGDGQLVHLGVPLPTDGEAFRTSGCPDCNRPFCNL